MPEMKIQFGNKKEELSEESLPELFEFEYDEIEITTKKTPLNQDSKVDQNNFKDSEEPSAARDSSPGILNENNFIE